MLYTIHFFCGKNGSKNLEQAQSKTLDLIEAWPNRSMSSKLSRPRKFLELAVWAFSDRKKGQWNFFGGVVFYLPKLGLILGTKIGSPASLTERHDYWSDQYWMAGLQL